jgi:uncharacterized protein YodC (DUF2158 family)
VDSDSGHPQDAEPEGVVVGARVQANHGGPVMTVTGITRSLAFCTWEEPGGLQYGTFARLTLRLVPAASA